MVTVARGISAKRRKVGLVGVGGSAVDADGIALALYWQHVDDMARASDQQPWAFLRNLHAADYALWREVVDQLSRAIPPLIIDADGVAVPREWV